MSRGRDRAGRRPSRRREAFASRDFRLLFAGQATSLLGDGIVPVAVAFAVLDLTGSATALGLVLAAGSIPTVLLVLVGGVAADRLSRRWVMQISDVVRAATQGTIAVLLLTGTAELWHMVVLTAVWGTGAAFFRPAYSGIVPEVVGPEHLQQANGLLGVTRNLGSIAGPAVAGVLVATIGPGWAFAVDAATFAVSAVFIAAMSHTRPAASGTSDGMATELREGWAEFTSRGWLVAIVVWAALFHLAVLAPFQVLGPVIADSSLGGASAWGVISAALGAGSVAGGLLALRLRVTRPMVVACLGLVAFAAPLALLAIPAPTILVAAGALLAGAGASVFGVLFTTVMQEQIPLESLSWVSAYDWLGSLALLPVGLALVGTVADSTSTSAVLAFGAIWMVVSTAAVLCSAGVRRITPGSVVASPRGGRTDPRH